MDTQIALHKDGINYNKFHEEIIKCKSCGNPTTMKGTKLCDGCWNAKGILSESDVETILFALDETKKKMLDLRVSVHFTREYKKERLQQIDSIKQKVKNLC